MPVRVELIDEAVADLRRYAASGNLLLFLKKLVRLEEDLAGFRNTPTPISLLGQTDDLCAVACAIFSL